MGKAKDLTGQVFGRLTVLKPTDKRYQGCVVWKCRCSCDGKIVEVSSCSLTSGLTKSCGCLQREAASIAASARAKDITGQVFGKLTALEPTDKRSGSSIIWICRCACDGKIVEVSSFNLVSGAARSCGCLRGETLSQYRSENCIANTHLEMIKIPESKLGKNNSSGVKGVCWHNHKHRWFAYIGFMKKKYIYYAKSFDEAVEKRRQMRAARDEFLDWWDSLTPEKQQEAAGSEDVVIYQRQQFEKRIKIILEG